VFTPKVKEETVLVIIIVPIILFCIWNFTFWNSVTFGISSHLKPKKLICGGGTIVVTFAGLPGNDYVRWGIQSRTNWGIRHFFCHEFNGELVQDFVVFVGEFVEGDCEE
jgi:hypothetical protein